MRNQANMYMYIYLIRQIAYPTTFSWRHLTLDLLARTVLYQTSHALKFFIDLNLTGLIVSYFELSCSSTPNFLNFRHFDNY